MQGFTFSLLTFCMLNSRLVYKCAAKQNIKQNWKLCENMGDSIVGVLV